MNFKNKFNKVHEKDTLDLCAGYEISPVVPVQSHNCFQTSQDCSESDRSELLIPLVTSHSNKHISNVKYTNHDSQNTEMCEESQSLLPQFPQETHHRHTFKPSTYECLSSSSCSQTVQDFPMLSLDQMKKDSELPIKICTDKRKSHIKDPSLAHKQDLKSNRYGLRQNRKTNNKYSEIGELPIKDESLVSKQGGKLSTKIDSMVEVIDKHTNGTHEDMEVLWSQKPVSDAEKTEDDITFSQIPLSQTVVGEDKRHLTSSQREITPTQAEKISSKIENLVVSLNKVPRKQMLVTEATLLQCISHLQDSLHKCLKKKHYVDDSIGTYRQLLITSQTGLAKISEFHKKEKIALNQTENTQTVSRTKTGLSQSMNRSMNDQAIKDLMKRQKRVLTLLKRQRCLVDLLKTIKRASSFEGDFDQPDKETTRVELMEGPHSTKPSLKSEDNTVDESLSHVRKKASHKDGPQKCFQYLKKSIHNEKVQQIQNLLEKENKVFDMEDFSLTRPEHILQTAGFDMVDKSYTVDDNLVSNDSQKYNTQDTLRTSGIDLFDYGEDVESRADTNKENDRYVEGIISQMFDTAKGRNVKKSVDDNLNTNIPVEISQKSSCRSNQAASEGQHDNQTNIVGSVKPMKIMHQKIMPRECNHHSEEIISDTKMHEMHDARVIKTRFDDKYDVNIVLNDSNDNDDVDEYETTEQGATFSGESIKDNDGTAQATNSKNVNANHLKRKIDLYAGNDVIEEMKMKKTEMKDAGPEKLGNVPYSEILWLNMLRNHSEKSKIYSEQQHPPNDKQNDEVLIAKKLPNIPLDNGDLGQEEIDSGRNSGTQKLVSSVDKNSNTLSYGTEFDIHKCNMNRSDTHNAEVEIPDELETMAELVNNNDDIDNQSPGVCSPLSLAVRGSPCETIDNVSPKGSTVCSEIFMLRPTQLDAQGQDHLDTVDGAHTFKINSKSYQTEISMPYKCNNPSTQPWIMPKRFDQISKPRIVDVSKGYVNDIETNNVKMTEEYTHNKDFNNCNMKPMTITDNISAAIDSVIQKSRVTDAGEVHVGDKKSSSKQKQAMLPSLKELVHGGVLTPGKHVLSFTLKGIMHKASLTQFGNVRTTDGHTFNTVSSWLSSLSDGVEFKKRKSYETVFYKGRSLLSYCKQIESSSNNQHTRVTEPCTHVTDRSTQVDTSMFNVQHCTMTKDEKWLNEMLSTSVVRLLSERDLVTNHDLPDNFWTEDLSKVTLHSDIWKSVVSW